MKKQTIAPEVDTILRTVPGLEESGFNDPSEIREMVDDFVDTMNEFYPGCGGYFVPCNTQLQPWKQNSNFVKYFYNEIDSCNLTKNEKEFLLTLGGYLAWGRNILINKNGTPMTQKDMIDVFDISKSTVMRNMERLEKKNCVFPVRNGKNKYYIVNPNLMFFGNKINPAIPQLFELGSPISTGED